MPRQIPHAGGLCRLRGTPARSRRGCGLYSPAERPALPMDSPGRATRQTRTLRKPLALDAAQCREMIAACAANRVLLMEAFMYRYTDRTRQVLEVLRS